MVLVSYMLPYKITRHKSKPGEFVAQQCFHNPTFLYGNLDNMVRKRTFNFYWIGIITTAEKLTEAEEIKATGALASKYCFPVFMTLDEVEPFYKLYEGLIRPKMHNFFDIYDSQFTEMTSYWNTYL